MNITIASTTLSLFLSTLSLTALASPVPKQHDPANTTGTIATGTINNVSRNYGFTGPHQGINSVNQVLNAGLFSDDMPVTLTGYIKASLGGERYLFTDGTGDIVVEIDYDKWFGQSITPQTRIQLYGEIDKTMLGTKVDVDMIHVI